MKLENLLVVDGLGTPCFEILWTVICIEYFGLKLHVLLYLILYRVVARPSGLQTTKSSAKEEMKTVEVDVEPGPTDQTANLSSKETVTSCRSSEALTSKSSPEMQVSSCENESLNEINRELEIEHSEDMDVVDAESTSDVVNKIPCSSVGSSCLLAPETVRDCEYKETFRSIPCSSVLEETCMEDQEDTNMAVPGPSPGSPNDFSSVSKDYQSTREDSEHIDSIEFKANTARVNNNYGKGCASEVKSGIPGEDGSTGTLLSSMNSFSTKISSAEMHKI